MEGKVQTVCGLVEPNSLGKTLTHEHLFMDYDVAFCPASQEEKHMEDSCYSIENLGWIRQNPYSHKLNIKLNRPEIMAAVMKEMADFKKLGGGTIVENSTVGLSRNVSFMRDISQKHGINIVAGTGYYVMASQTKEVLATPVEQMVNFMTKEITVGCEDAPDIKCGIIGESGCTWPLYEFERRAIQATGETQASLGCPVMFHPGRNPDAPEEIVRIYSEAGGDIKKMVVAHLDRTLTRFDDLVEFASLGTFCEFDLFGIEVSHYQLNRGFDMPSDAQRIAYIKHLVDHGFGDKIVIAHDVHTVNRLEAYGGHGYSHIFRNIVPKMLDRGLSQEDIDKILISNPSNWLTFSK